MTTEKRYRLYIFDLDGTLAPFNSDELYADASEWIRRNVMHPAHSICIATNQGGIGLRYWMERDSFGEPNKYPTLASFKLRIEGLFPHKMRRPVVFMCARYQSRKGTWSPVPKDVDTQDGTWKEDWRKPQPGMLVHAMTIFLTTPEQTLMIGDSEEDRLAAITAGCDFQWAWQFFDRPAPLTSEDAQS